MRYERHVTRFLRDDNIQLTHQGFTALVQDLKGLMSEISSNIHGAYDELLTRIGGAEQLPRFVATLVPQRLPGYAPLTAPPTFLYA